MIFDMSQLENDWLVIDKSFFKQNPCLNLLEFSLNSPHIQIVAYLTQY